MLQSHQFNGITQTCAGIAQNTPYNSRMFTLMRQLDWLSLLILKCYTPAVSTFSRGTNTEETIECAYSCAWLLTTYCCPERTIPLTLNPMKQSKNKPRIRRRLVPPGNVVNHRLKLRLDSCIFQCGIHCRSTSQFITAFVSGCPAWPLTHSHLI